jgi:hypothetical protein
MKHGRRQCQLMLRRGALQSAFIPASSVAGVGPRMTYIFKTIPSPVGQLKLVASEVALLAVLWEDDKCLIGISTSPTSTA